MNKTSISSAKKEEHGRIQPVKILTQVKTKSKKLSKNQAKILTKFSRVKKSYTNKQLAEELNISKQSASYSIQQLILKNLLFKNGDQIYKIDSQNSHEQTMNPALHKCFSKTEAQPAIKKFPKCMSWTKITKLNGSTNYYLDTVFDTINECKRTYYHQYGIIKYTMRIQISKEHCFFYLYFDKPPVLKGDFKQAEDDYKFLSMRILNHFTKKEYPEFNHIKFDKLLFKADHYKISDLPKELEGVNYNDGKGGFTDSSEVDEEIEHQKRESAQALFDAPKNIQKLGNRIDDIETQQLTIMESYIKKIETRFAGIMKVFAAQDKDSELNHELIKHNLNIYI